MTIDNLTPYNADFWNYLRIKLKEAFKSSAINYDFMIFPTKISVHSIAQKTKTTAPTLINAKIVFFIDDTNEMEYVTKIILGSHSRKAYRNTKGSAISKCFPISKPFSDWIKIEEFRKEIQIHLC